MNFSKLLLCATLLASSDAAFAQDVTLEIDEQYVNLFNDCWIQSPREIVLVANGQPVDIFDSWIQSLIASGEDLNQPVQAFSNLTPLSRAAYVGHVKALKSLIDAGADINKETNGTPLCWAAEIGHIECVQILIDAGAIVDKSSTMNTTPLWRAASQGNVRCLEILLSAGANPNIPSDGGLTPLFIAALHQNVECIKILAENGANLNQGTRWYQESPLYAAAQNGKVASLKALIEAGADINQTNYKGQTPLIVSPHFDCLKLLIKAGAEVNRARIDGNTALHQVVVYNVANPIDNYESAKLLIDAGANVLQKNNQGKSPLDLAKELGNQKMISLLQKHSRKNSKKIF